MQAGLPTKDAEVTRNLELLVSNRDDLADYAFHQLQRCGIDLSGKVLYLAMFKVRNTDGALLNRLEAIKKEILFDAGQLFSTQFQVYRFSYNSIDVTLLTQPKSDDHQAQCTQNAAFIEHMSHYLIGKYAQYQFQVLVSGETEHCGELTYCCGALYHATEFSYFLTEPPDFAVVDFKKQSLSYTTETLFAYRKLCLKLIQLILADQLDAHRSAVEICETVLDQTEYSANALHGHMILFATCFLERLLSDNVVDHMYLAEENILNELRMGNNEVNYTSNLERILKKINGRHKYIAHSISSERMKQVRQYVEDNISDVNLSVMKISEHFSINRGTLTEEFKRYFGSYLSTYISQQRLEFAQRLIDLYPALPVQKVAEQAGYSDISTMYRTFKRNGFPTPSSMRKHS